MKLHLPVQLFRAVIALMAVAMPFSASAARKYEVSNGQQLTLSGLDELNLNISGYYVSAQTYPYGGAIYAGGTGSITIEHYVNLLFKKNYVSDSATYGGAIYSKSGAITLSENESVTFSGNYSEFFSTSDASYRSYYGGGAIYSESGAITLSGNESVTFSGNYASSSSLAYATGGAIYSKGGTITLSGNGSVTFSGNYSKSSYSTYSGSYGGAIYSSGSITLSGNKSVTFSGNYASSSVASSRGGAIYSGSITLSGNESVTFSDNYAAASSSSSDAKGGAIYSSGAITLSGNGSVTFSGNHASYGGAIYGKNINIRDNGSVVFKQNYETSGGGLYATGNTALSAASGNYIEFQESMYVGGVLELNNLYTNEAGKSVAQRGDIIFTGAYAAGLNNTRTSNVSGITTLYDGRLIVRDGAILSGAGLTVASSASGYSIPTVLLENAKLNHAGASVSFASGTCLEARGQSGIGCSNLTMGSASALTLHAAGGNMSAAVLSVYGSFTMGDSLTLNISFNDDTAEAGIYRLMSVTSFDNASNWTADKVTVNGLDSFELSFDALYWEDNTLYLNYDGNAGVAIPPPLTEATWSNLSGTHEWDMSDKNWKQDKYTYAYTDGVAVVFGDTAAGGVVLVGELTPDSVLVNNSEGHDYTWEGDPTKGGSLTGNMSLTKKGDGSLSIYTDNSYLGDTVIEGGKLVVGSADALGKGTVRLMGGMLEVATNDFDNLITAGGTAEIMVQQGSTLKLKRKIYNTEGILTLKGTIDVSALESVHIDAALVDVNGEIGTSGFARAAATGVQLVQGGMVEAAGATVLYNGEVLQVDTTGFGATIPTIDYSVYSINGRHSVATSAINAQAGAALTCIELNSGTLTADTAVSNLKALGGTLLMPQQVTVNGSVQDTLVYASAGQLNATLSGGSAVQVSGAVSISGNNTHTGGTILNNGSLTVTNSKALGTGSIITQGTSSIKANAALTLTEAIINTGTLTLSGRYNVSALELIGSGSVRVDVTGNTGASGFLKSGGSRVLVVAGGTVVNNGATVTYNGTNLTLGSDGYATMGSTGIDYSEYLLTGTDAAATSAIHSGAGAGAVIRQQGGTLTVNDMAEVNATGGSIILKTGGLLSGTLSGSTITAEGGSLTASLSGSNTINGDGYVLNSLFNNEGMLVLSGSFDVSALSPETSAGGRVDLNGNVTTAGNGFARSEGKRVQLTTGGSTSDGGVSINYLDIQLKLGTDGYATSGGETDYSTYYQTSGAASTQAIHLESAAASVEMSGGTLTVNDFATVQSSGGNIIVANNGDLRGSVSGATVTAQGGNIGALFKGTNTLTGQNYNLTNVLQNAGALTLKGSFKTDALQLETVQSSRINTEGQTGNSGFMQHGGFRVQLVSGGTVLNGGATVKYGSTVLSLGSDGYAYNGGGIDYSEYLLTGTDSAVLSKIISAGGSALSNISMNGGVLTVDADTALLNATGGTINAVSGTLGGSVSDATINASGGTINAILLGDTSVQITGAVSMAGYNSHTGGVLLNNGTLTLHNAEALGGGSIVSMGVSALQLNDTLILSEVMLNMGTLSLSGNIDASALTADTGAAVYVNTEGVIGSSGFLQSGGYRVQIVTGGTVVNNGVEITYNGDTLTLGTDGYASSGAGTSYGTYYLNGSDSVRVSEALAASGYALGGIQMTGGTLYADAATKVTATGGNIMLSSGVLSGTVSNAQVKATGGTLSAKLSGVASLAASGTLSITGANTHSGGTSFSGGTFTLAHGAALGNGLVVMAGTNTLAATTVVTLNDRIINNGALTMTGTYDASALELSSVGISYVDCLGNTGNSGFQKGAGHSVQVVNGGTVSGNATIKHGSLTLTLGSDGYATGGGGISYGTYYLNSGDSVSVSTAEAASSNALTTVSMSGGTLYADASTKVTATGGNIMLSAGTLSGTAKNTHVTATGGTLSVALSGTGSLNAKGTMTISGANSHTGGSIFNGGTFTLSNATSLGNGNVMTIGTNTLKANTAQTLKNSILNSGTLTLSGSWNISALALQTTAATHVDIYGHSGASGFAKSALYEVQVVLGGTSKVNNLTLTHSKLGSGLKLLLGSDGVASAGGVVDYSNYLLTDGDSADVSDILGAAGGKLDNVTMTGGNLNVDDSVVVDAAGGKIDITGDSTLSGSITDTEVTLGKGSYKSDISADITGDSSLTINGGDVTLSGDNNYTGGTVINGGSLTAGDDTALGSGSITVNGGTLDLNNQELGNDITLNDGHLMGNNNYNGNLSIGGDNVSVEGGYTLGAGKVLSVAVGGTEFGSDLTLAGGTLLFEGAPLTVDGAVSFTAGTTTRVNLSQWQGRLTDGLTLAVFGDDVVGWTDGCLELIGMNDMSLGFDAATGTLTLQIEGQQPAAETITWLGAKKTVWQTGKAGWMNATTGHDAVFETGADVIFTQSGTVTIAGAVEPGSVIVAGDKAITFKSDKKNPGRIVGETALTKRGNGKLTLNDGNFYSGGTVIEAGTVVAGGASAFGRGDITISGGTLDLKSKAVTNDITLTGVATIKGGNKFGGELTLDGELLKGSVLNVAASAELKSGTVNGTLSGIGTVTVSGEATLGTTGKITTNALDVSGTLNVGTKGLAMNAKSSAITVEEGGKLQSAGLLKAYSMEVNGGEVLFNTAKATSVTLGNNLVLRNGASMSLSGKMNVGNLYMDNAQLLLRDPSGKNLAMGLTAKGNVTLGSGSALTLSGKLTAANLTLDGGALTLTSNKLQTITVKNTLTLGAAFDLNFSFNLTEGKAVKLFTFKSITGSTSDLYAQLGLSDEFCTLTLNARDITLLVTDLDGLRGYMENTAKADASAAEPEEEKVSAEELLTAPQPVAAAAVDPLLRKTADTLVQSTWGTVNASRAFGDTIAARGAHATLLAEGRGAAWLSTMGGSSRISTDGERNGADFTLSGAAFGVEGRVTEKSTLGVAIGNSWGKVSTFSAFPVEQDSMHIGIYGNHTLTESLTLSWMATHTRTESELNMLGLPYEWAQDALQLDARLTWATAISDKTTLRVFGGLQYLATDSGESNGQSTGSVQNLRGELGIGASHKCSDSTLVFGELSFVGDMVRNNPTADLGDMRLRGSNPGRAGINLSVGAAHRLSDDWSLNASYSFELMQNVTSHSLNVGASYSF